MLSDSDLMFERRKDLLNLFDKVQGHHCNILYIILESLSSHQQPIDPGLLTITQFASNPNLRKSCTAMLFAKTFHGFRIHLNKTFT